MSCEITDYVTNFTPGNVKAPIAGAEVVASFSLEVGLFFRVSGVWLKPQLPATRTAIADSNGLFTLILPTPSESFPSDILAYLEGPDGVILGGPVPEASGPFTLHDLVTNQGWGAVSPSEIGPVAVIGGSSAFTTLTASFIQPAVSSTVTAQVVSSAWMAVGMVIYIAAGGYYQITAIADDTHATISNLGYTGNASPSATVPSAGAVVSGGLAGPSSTGVSAYTTLTTSFVQPSVSSTVVIAVVSSAWMVVGEVVYVAGGGYYTVSAITNSTHATLTNLGYTGNASPSATVPSLGGVSPGGLAGPTGSTGAAGSNGTNGTNGADGNPRFFKNNATTLTTRGTFKADGTLVTFTDDGAGPDTISIAVPAIYPIVQDYVIYLNESTGSDSNDGSVGSPVQTLAGAFKKYPITAGKRRILVLQSDTSAANFPTTMNFPPGLGSQSEPIIVIGAITVDALGTRTSTAGTTGMTLVDSTLTLTTDQLVGAFIKMTSGSSNGKISCIAANTATTLSLRGDFFGTTISPGDTFQIIRPSRTIGINTNSNWKGLIPGITFVGCKFQISGGVIIWIIQNALPEFAFCEFDGGGSGFFRAGPYCAWISGSTELDVSAYISGNFTSLSLPGVYVHDALRFDCSGYGSQNQVLGGVFKTVTTLGVVTAGRFTLSSCECISSGVTISTGGFGLIGGGTYRKTMIRSASGTGLTIATGAVVSSMTDLDVSSCGSNGISIATGAIVEQVSTVTGTGNGGVGMRIATGAEASLASSVTVTGSGGDVQIGNHAVQTWASVFGAASSIYLQAASNELAGDVLFLRDTAHTIQIQDASTGAGFALTLKGQKPASGSTSGALALDAGDLNSGSGGAVTLGTTSAGSITVTRSGVPLTINDNILFLKETAHTITVDDSASGAGGALTIRAGKPASGSTSGALVLDAGTLNAGTGGAVQIGVTNAGSLELGRSTVPVLINDDLNFLKSVAHTIKPADATSGAGLDFTIKGQKPASGSVSGALILDAGDINGSTGGAITIGATSAASLTLGRSTVPVVITDNLTFLKSVAHTITVQASTSGAGAALTIQSGSGASGQAVGALTIDVGTRVGGGAGAILTIGGNESGMNIGRSGVQTVFTSGNISCSTIFSVSVTSSAIATGDTFNPVYTAPNTSAASGGTPIQRGGYYESKGFGWTGAASISSNWSWGSRPINAATVRDRMAFQSNNNAAGQVERFTITDQYIDIMFGMARARAAKTSNYTATVSDNIIAVDSTGGAVTITLPLANVKAGWQLTVKDEGQNGGTNNITIARAGSDTFGDGGGTTLVINTNGGSKTIYADGTSKYFVIGST